MDVVRASEGWTRMLATHKAAVLVVELLDGSLDIEMMPGMPCAN